MQAGLDGIAVAQDPFDANVRVHLTERLVRARPARDDAGFAGHEPGRGLGVGRQHP